MPHVDYYFSFSSCLLYWHCGWTPNTVSFPAHFEPVDALNVCCNLYCSLISFSHLVVMENFRTWWQRNLVAVVVGIVATLLLGLSILGLWSVWRHRREASKTYQPVGAVVPEQELQPLKSWEFFFWLLIIYSWFLCNLLVERGNPLLLSFPYMLIMLAHQRWPSGGIGNLWSLLCCTIKRKRKGGKWRKCWYNDHSS